MPPFTTLTNLKKDGKKVYIGRVMIENLYII